MSYWFLITPELLKKLKALNKLYKTDNYTIEQLVNIILETECDDRLTAHKINRQIRKNKEAKCKN